MKNLIKLLSISLFILMVGNNRTLAQKKLEGNFVHTVFFWLKNPDSKSDREKFEASLKKFIDQSVFIKSKHLGLPAATNRTVIDNSYTYCLIVTFANKADQDKYQEEAGHLLFIKESQDLWKKVLVYDSENIW